jgi:folate-dependent phosphoribosylglycinamide formyltransferase PurN
VVARSVSAGVPGQRLASSTLVLTIIGSSGGSALRGAVHCLRSAHRDVRLLVITDRECGLSDWARAEQLPTAQASYANAAAFSDWAHERMCAAGSTDALLFFTRRVAGPLVHDVHTCNIHPSLLPEFPGLHAVRDARTADAPLLGATLHHVDDTLDTGPIAGQVWCPMPPSTAARHANRLSYLQKVWLTLAWIDHRTQHVALPAVSDGLRTPATVSAASQRHFPSGAALASGTIAPLDPALRRAYRRFAQDALGEPSAAGTTPATVGA